MSKTRVEIEVRMTLEQIQAARANLMEIHPEMIDQIREMSMEELIKLAWLDVVSGAKSPTDNSEAKKQLNQLRLPKQFTGSKVDVEEIDDLLDDGYDPDSFVGKKLVYHNNRAYRLMKLPRSMLVAAISHRCGFCKKNPVTLFHGSGLHNGAWCYAYGLNGEYAANFRDQHYVCAVCDQARQTQP